MIGLTLQRLMIASQAFRQARKHTLFVRRCYNRLCSTWPRYSRRTTIIDLAAAYAQAQLLTRSAAGSYARSAISSCLIHYANLLPRGLARLPDSDRRSHSCASDPAARLLACMPDLPLPTLHTKPAENEQTDDAK